MSHLIRNSLGSDPVRPRDGAVIVEGPRTPRMPMLSLLLVLALHAPDLPASSVTAPASHSSVPAIAGTVRGRVVVEARPARRRARAYSGGTPSAPQRVPRLVWISGTVDGHPPTDERMPEMAQQDTVFVPSFVAVPVGGRVDFPNRDAFFHNVFSYSSGARFDLGAYARGESKNVAFDEPGLVTVFCEVHDRMRSAILVTENPFHTPVGPDGEFELRGVPAGRYTLVAWDVDRGSTEVEIVVRDGEATDVEIVIG